MAITESEINEAALGELEKFKAMENCIVENLEGERQTVVEAKLMGAVVELRAWNHIFRPPSSIEDLVNPSGKLEIDEDADLFKSDAGIIEAACKGVSEEEDVDNEIEECSPSQIS